MEDQNQQSKMKWILFYVFVSLFVIIVILTIASVFFNMGKLSDDMRKTLSTAFILEIGGAVVALFYSMFNLRRTDKSRIRLTMDNLTDVKAFINKKAVLSLCLEDGSDIKTIESKVFDDNGPFIPLSLPSNVANIYVSIEVNNTQYSGSMAVGTYMVELV
jgi:hypothetical protein